MKFSRKKNNLTTDPGDFYAQPEDTRTLSLEEFCDMVGSSNQGLSSVQCKNDLMIIGNVLKSAVKMELGVNLGFVLLQTGISGILKPAEGESTLEGEVHASPSRELQAEAKKWTFTEVAGRQSGPRIDTIEDADTGSVNGVISPDGVITITGRGLPPEGEGSGISLKNAAGAETPVTNPLALKNPTKLIVQLPAALAPGAYRLVIRTRFNRSGAQYSTLQTGESSFTVTVEPAKH